MVEYESMEQSQTLMRIYLMTSWFPVNKDSYRSFAIIIQPAAEAFI